MRRVTVSEHPSTWQIIVIVAKWQNVEDAAPGVVAESVEQHRCAPAPGEMEAHLSERARAICARNPVPERTSAGTVYCRHVTVWATTEDGLDWQLVQTGSRPRSTVAMS